MTLGFVRCCPKYSLQFFLRSFVLCERAHFAFWHTPLPLTSDFHSLWKFTRNE